MSAELFGFAAAAATIVVGAELVVAGAAKLARAPAMAVALRRAGFSRPLGGAAWRLLGAVELAVGIGLWALWAPARLAAAGLLLAFAGWQVQVVVRGRDGAPCPCFGARTTVSRGSAAHVVVLAVVATTLALAPTPDLGLAGWLAVLVGLLSIACAALAGIAYTLARDVAALRARAGARGALEIEAEGPPRGGECPLIERFSVQGGELALAVFLSPGCRVCAQLEPAIAEVSEQPGVEVVVFDEERDVLAWRAADVPGSPYAVAMSADGVVLAKGTFNTAEQLASIPGTALWRRAAEVVRA